jgi:hypothetical protein
VDSAQRFRLQTPLFIFDVLDVRMAGWIPLSTCACKRPLFIFDVLTFAWLDEFSSALALANALCSFSMF